VANFSATAYYFGLLLNQILDVPIGLISSSVGGTPIEAWMSKSALEKFDFTSVPAELPKVEKPQLTPTVLFNGMINPLVGYGIRGAIWYQGENNRMQPQQYLKLMPGLIQDWRNGWGIGDFPFYYVQIAPYNYNSKSFSSAYMREAQLKASTILPNTGMACILDLGEKDNIHPANKYKVSERLALLALTQTYGIKGVSGRSPVYKSMKIEKSEVKLTFDHAPGGLTSYGNELKNFEIAGADSIFLPAKAILTKEGITVSSELVKEPLAVRYAFKDFVVGDLFGCNGFPVSSFRTDDWKY
jgi:sialate O-acetylesterase